jgi:DNA-binding FadR family transcriptional regulator
VKDDKGDHAARGPAPDPSLDQLVATLRRRNLDEGGLPPERQLAAELNIKRHQLRKALFRMRDAGELHPVRGRRPTGAGLSVSNEELVRMTNPLEVLECRMVLEPGLARLASLRASAVEIARILDLASTPAGTGGGEQDLRFHFAVVRASRNHLAEEFYRTMRQVGFDARMRIARSPSSTCPKRIAMRDAEHMRVAEAIRQRDPEAAEAAMRVHLNSVMAQVNRLSSSGFAAE